MKKIFTSIWFLALIVAIPITLVIPPIFNKYKVELIKQENRPIVVNSRIYFEDIDSDGIPERIESFSQNGNSNRFLFQFFRENGGMVDQINFPLEFSPEMNRLHFADVDNDGNKEIYFFSFKKDSLLLHWIQITPKTGPFQTLPICEINTYNDGKIDYQLGKIYCLDLDADKQKELVFAVIGGFSISPRQIFIVDIKNRKIVKSENTGCANAILTFSDLNNDDKMEIIADGQVAPIRDWLDLPYNRPAPYLKVFDSDFNYFFPPAKFYEGIQSSTSTCVIGEGENKELFTTFLSGSADCVPFRAYKINLKGEKTDSLLYESSERMHSKMVFRNKRGNFITQIKPSVFLEYTNDLKFSAIHKLETTGNLNLLFNGDINGDGVFESLFTDVNRDVIHLFSDNFKWYLPIHLNDICMSSGENILFKGNQIYLLTGNGYLIYSFDKNPLFLLRFPVYISIYFICLLLVFLLQKIIESRLKEKYELQSQVRDLQLLTLKNQLDPHFIFNTFNTIASVVKNGKADEGYDMIVQFSKMVRNNLEGSTKIETTLKKEIDFVKDYLDIQRFRFKDEFEYKIQIDKEVDLSVLVPKLIIQIHVENALKHGIRNSKHKGIIQVNVKKQQGGVQIEIEDNGIGREEAKKQSSNSTGLGLKTIQQIIDLSNQKRKTRITQHLLDLKDEIGNARGTNVVVHITS
ncbi:MAG: histidine kinase [Bacteroidetes bacterium]|nr:histidine kinase [Bacteroidota bacterium]